MNTYVILRADWRGVYDAAYVKNVNGYLELRDTNQDVVAIFSPEMWDSIEEISVEQ